MTEKGNENRRKFSKEFKVDAVEMIMRSNKYTYSSEFEFAG